MQCPYCNKDTSVTNSRPSAKFPEVWRRRQCKSCQSIWTTREVLDLSTSHRILTSQNHLEPFLRDKLFISIKDSCVHRKTALVDASALTDTVINGVLTLQSPEITSKKLKEQTHAVLSRFDPIAAAVYAAKYNVN